MRSVAMHGKRKRSSNSKEETGKTLKKNDDKIVPTEKLFWSFSKAAILGKGSYGNVEIWYNHSTSNLYAAKMFRNQETYIHELQKVKELNHDNVIKFVESYDDQRVIFFQLFTRTLSELLEEDLENSHGLSEELLYLLLKHMSLAMDYLLHRKHMVHRDIKPQNILFDGQTRNFVLTDFGLAVNFDPQSLTYESVPSGTSEFAHPTLLVLPAKSQTISIDTELWSLAVTFFMAATAKHPFQTKPRSKWIDLARNKPENSFWVDVDGNYMYEFNKYCRLSREFLSQVFAPLLVSMMKPGATFKNYFEKVDVFMNLDVLHVFDCSKFRFHRLSCTIDRENLQDVISRSLNYTDFVLVHGDKILSDKKGCIPRTTKDSPVVCFAGVEKDSNTINELFVNALNFLKDEKRKPTKKDIQSVFLHVNDVINFCDKQKHLCHRLYLSLFLLVEKKQAQLSILKQCFDEGSTQFFRLQEPNVEFKNLLDVVEAATSQALVPATDPSVLDENDLLQHPDVIAFRQHLDFIDQQKLVLTRQEHVRQTVKSLERAVEAVVTEMDTFAEKYVKMVSKTREHISTVEDFISKQTFSIAQLNTQIIKEIVKITNVS